MQTFKLYFKLLNKNKVAVIIYFAIFMFISLILSNVLSGESSSGFTQSKLKIAVVDEGSETAKNAIKEYFGDNNTVSIIKNDMDDIQNSLYWRKYDYVIIIPEDFEKTHELNSMKVPGQMTSSLFESELTMYMSKVNALTNSGDSLQAAFDKVNDLKDNTAKVSMADFVNQAESDKANLLFCYAAYCFISVGVASVGMILIILNKKELKERIDCGSVTLKKRVGELTLAILASGLLLLLAVVIAAYIMSGGTILTDIRFPFYLINMTGMLLFSLSLGFMSGMLVKNKEAINGIVNIAGLGLAFLGGIFVPQEFFSDGVNKVARFLPTYWYVKSNTLIGSIKTVTTDTIRELLLNTSIIVGFAGALFMITLVAISVKRKSK